MAKIHYVVPEQAFKSPHVVLVHPRALAQVLVFVPVLVYLIMVYSDITRMSVHAASVVASLVVPPTILFACWSATSGLWSPSAAYITIYAFFHFGLVFTYTLDALSNTWADHFSAYFDSPFTPHAIALSLLGLAACMVGIGVATLTKPISERRDMSTRAPSGAATLAKIGSMAVVAGVVLWFYLMISYGGPSFLFASYEAYWKASETVPIGLPWILIGSGLCLVAATYGSATRRWMVLAFGAFGLITLISLPLGVRGESMFIVFGVLILLVRRGVRIPAGKTVLVVLAALFLISVIKTIRDDQPLNNSLSPVTIADSVSEMGGSLRPVVEVLRWQDTGDEFANGATYWAPFDRMICSTVPGGACIPAEEDERLMNVITTKRVGSMIGFSVVAEAFRNFGAQGVVVVMLIVGAIIGSLDRMRGGPYGSAIVGIVTIELLSNVRNAFIGMPVQILAGFALIGACMALKSMTKRKMAPLDIP